MRLTKPAPPAVLSMEERGRVPPGVGTAGAMSSGGDLAMVGVLVILELDIWNSIVR